MAAFLLAFLGVGATGYLSGLFVSGSGLLVDPLSLFFGEKDGCFVGDLIGVLVGALCGLLLGGAGGGTGGDGLDCGIGAVGEWVGGATGDGV